MDIPNFVLKFLFWQKSCQERVQSGCLGERETGCLIHVSVSVCGYEIQSWSMGLTVCSIVCICDWLSVCSNLGLWVCVFQSWYMGLTVCSNLGICVWLCVPVLVSVSDLVLHFLSISMTVCVFQSWSVCLTMCS